MNTATIDYTAFRKNFVSLVKSRNKLLKDIAKTINVSPVTLSRYVTGNREPELAYVIRIAQYFGVSIDWRLGYSANETASIPDRFIEMINLYAIATPEDRLVVDALLGKYREEKS